MQKSLDIFIKIFILYIEIKKNINQNIKIMKENILWGLKTLAQMLVALGVIVVLAATTIKWLGIVLIIALAIAWVVSTAHVITYEFRTGKKFPKTEDELLK